MAKSTLTVPNTVNLLKMTQLIPSAIPIRVFEEHEARVSAVAVFSDKRRMVTSSDDKILRLWDLTTGVVLKKMEGHCNRVQALAVSRDGSLIASGDTDGKLIAWDGTTGERYVGRYGETCQPTSVHTGWILSLDFSSDGKVLASGSSDSTTTLWNTKTWKLLGDAISCGTSVRYVRYSPSQPILAIATEHNIQIYHAGYYPWNCSGYSGYCYFEAHHTATISEGHSYSLTWTPDGRLLTGGDYQDPTIREWVQDSSSVSTWKQVGDPLKGHFNTISSISLNSNGTLLASASHDNRVRLWRLSDRRTIAVFKHSGEVNCVTFSAGDKYILSGGVDKKISEWPTSEDALPEDCPQDGLMKVQVTHQAQAYSNFKVLVTHSAARNACIAGDLPAAEKVLNLEINTAPSDHTFYANRAFVMARKGDWNHALHNAMKSLGVQPSFSGHISKGIALCGKKQVRAARTSFDLAAMFTTGNLKTNHFLFFIKTIALFNANEHDEAMQRVEELAVSPNADPLACRVIEAYLRVKLGNIALDCARNSEALDHFTAAVNASTFFYTLDIHSMYEEFVVLFGWELKSLWHTVHQQHCHALFQAGRIGAAIESFQSIMDKSDDITKTSLTVWFNALQ